MLRCGNIFRCVDVATAPSRLQSRYLSFIALLSTPLTPNTLPYIRAGNIV